MTPKRLLFVSAAVALAGCGSATSQTANPTPSAQPVALQTTTIVAKHSRAMKLHKRVAAAKPAAAAADTSTTQTQTQVVAVTPPTAAVSTPAGQPPATTTTATAAPAHKHKKKSTGTSAGGTPLNSQGY